MKNKFLLFAFGLSFAAHAMDNGDAAEPREPFIRCLPFEESLETVKFFYFNGKTGFACETKNTDAVLYANGDKYLQGSEGWELLKQEFDNKLAQINLQQENL